MKNRYLIITFSAFCILFNTTSFAENSEDTSKQNMMRMDQHWQKLIGEGDPNKRKQMMTEHRRMMEEIRNKKGINQGHHMFNVLDMHESMMGMMK